MATDYKKLKRKVEDDLYQRLGRRPTDKEVDLEMNIRIIDSAGGSVTDYRHGKHKK